MTPNLIEENDYSDFWVKLAESEHEHLKTVKAQNRIILRKIKSIRGKQFVRDLNFIMYELQELCGKSFLLEYKITNKPSGKKQSASSYCKVIKSEYVEQYCYFEDSYQGTVSIEILPNIYFQTNFDC